MPAPPPAFAQPHSNNLRVRTHQGARDPSTAIMNTPGYKRKNYVINNDNASATKPPRRECTAGWPVRHCQTGRTATTNGTYGKAIRHNLQQPAGQADTRRRHHRKKVRQNIAGTAGVPYLRPHASREAFHPENTAGKADCQHHTATHGRPTDKTCKTTPPKTLHASLTTNAHKAHGKHQRACKLTFHT